MPRLDLFALLLLAFICAGAASARAGGIDDAEAGRSAYSRGDYDLAIENYTRAIRSGELSGENLAAVYTGRGIVYYIESQSERAIADYSEALSLDPGHVEAWYMRGIAYWLQGRHDLAISDYTEALSLDPGHVNAASNRDAAYALSGQGE
ncbi:MAG: tetratricopeptide repeat protein [Alphaproteobacteria bacterium]|jgi:tetratricopeptide (TPR) repeat protein|nr:tetratricopeptide repeat protein [Alphaproteobacteria bacterium]